MITIKTFEVNPFPVNCYVISDESNECCIIDCGCFYEQEWNRIQRYITEKGLTPVHLLNTHMHFDHIMGNGFAARDYKLCTEGSYADYDLYTNPKRQLSEFMITLNDAPLLPPMGRTLNGGDCIHFGSHTMTVLATPGHSKGGLCYYIAEEDILFSGDTLFCGTIGRTDLSGGDFHEIIRSITEQLLTLPANTRVFPGHGPQTTIGTESASNAYL